MGITSLQNAKRAVPAVKTDNCPLCLVIWLIWLFPALQPIMLVIQVLMALFLGIGNLGIPATLLHDFLSPENGIFKVVIAVNVGRIFNQVGVFNVPPAITITNTGNVPGGVADGTGYELAEFYGLKHRMTFFRRKKGDLSW
jgi:hypothetical protein